MRTYLPLMAALLFAACSSSPTPTPDAKDTGEKPPVAASATADIVGAWTLTTIAGRAALRGTTLTLESGKASGNSGCNSYNGPYTLAGSTLGVTSVTRTERACVDGAKMDQETEFFAMLESSTKAARKGAQLTLTGPKGELVFTRAQPNKPTIDLLTVLGEWKLDTIFDGNAASTPIAGRDITMTFAADAIRANLGCNITTASYTAQAEALTFSKMTMTKRACAGEGGGELMRQEQSLAQTLSGVTAHKFDKNSLTLLKGDVPVLRWTRVVK